jgi:hypothetical protein
VEPYTLVLKDNETGATVHTQQITDGPANVSVSLTGNGVKFYQVWINATQYETIKVDFNA